MKIPEVMGILNVTSDSFSDGGEFAAIDAALARGRQMWEEGAAIIDVGGESTRPGAEEISIDAEIARISPVVRDLAAEGIRISLDTRRAAVMRAGLLAGASMINDVSGLSFDPLAAPLVAEHGCEVVLMHSRGTPQTMAGLNQYNDLLGDVIAELGARVEAALHAGIASDKIILDPGFGFAKSGAQNVELLANLARLHALKLPLLVGVSRKSVVGFLTGEKTPKNCDAGSIAAALYAAQKGARLLRVHEVAGHIQALRVWRGLGGFARG